MKKNTTTNRLREKKEYRTDNKKIKATRRESRVKPFSIVGIGASAGGIKAFISLLEGLNPDLGMAYVLILHLSPNHKSALAEIMQFKTTMKVQTVKDGMVVIPNNVYVIPPNTFMSIMDGRLKLAPRSLTAVRDFSVDYFLTALAESYKNKAIGIILSGTATDGTLGLKAIKAEGGITFAQDESAEFDGMPGHAYDAGYVDFRLSPKDIATELERLTQNPYTILPADKNEELQSKEIREQADELQRILSLIKNKTGIDFFQNYKHASVYRRILRRMALNKFEKLSEYYAMLKHNSGEVDALYDDFLINVTYFFRDPDFYKMLLSKVFPAIVDQRKATEPLRIWIAGCSSGEEAYSVAIHLIEFLERNERSIPIQLFATDLDSNAIEKARSGTYPVSGLVGVSPAQLKKFFTRHTGFYQINKSVRQICVFSQHNLLKDPPFPRMDLISCQNVLIYLETRPQEKILQTFHYALKSQGFLFLGKSETIGSSVELFHPLDKRVKIYSKNASRSPQLKFAVDTDKNNTAHVGRFIAQRAELNVEKAMSKLVLSSFVHPCVAINKSLSIMHFYGATTPYLQPGFGKASLNILKMAREELVLDLGMLIQEAKKSEKAVSKSGIRILDDNTTKTITIEVVPSRIAEETFFLVVFKENGVIPSTKKTSKSVRNGSANSKTIGMLEAALSHSRALVRTTNEEYETTFEELQANGEEILSSNEELQSINEELESSREELQSAIEELTTTNLELSTRNADLDKSQKTLKKVNGQLEQFVFISSHDLQEPLRKIQMFADRLLDARSELNSFAKNYAKKIQASSARMATLVKDLVSYSLLDKDNKKTVPVDLNQILKDVVFEFAALIEEKNAVVKVATMPVVPADPIQMNQLFHNLLSNSLKFSSAQPEITISSRDSMAKDFVAYHDLDSNIGYVVISFSDNGIGFEDRYLDKMFTLFQRLQDQKDMPGTGVGLTMCKAIAEDHGGRIYGHGEKGRSATFVIFLPREQL